MVNPIQIVSVLKAMRLSAVLLLLCIQSFGQDPWKNVYSSPAWKDRDKWQRPDELIRLLNIKTGSHVADVGCHEGYMTFKLSSVVGAHGSVYAVDVDQSKLDKLNNSVTEQKINNIQVIKGDY